MPRSKPDKSRSRGKASAKAAKPNPSPVRKKPLLDLCRGAGWAPQHLDQAAATDQELTALLIKELVACREAGKLDLTLALCDAAKARGLVHPRIATIRERAKRSQQHPVAKPKGSSGAGRAAPRKLTILQRLGLALGLRSSGSKSGVKRPKPGPERQAQAQGSKPKPEPSPAAVISPQLEALRHVCRQAGWAPQCLQGSEGVDVALACGQEMQSCRQAGQHALVVALATEAAVLGIDHPRIQENLQRSRSKAARANVIAQARALLEANPPALRAAAVLLADALLAEPDGRDYRKLLTDAVRAQIQERSGSALAPELRDAAVDLEVNELLLEALERRRQSS